MAESKDIGLQIDDNVLKLFKGTGCTRAGFHSSGIREKFEKPSEISANSGAPFPNSSWNTIDPRGFDCDNVHQGFGGNLKKIFRKSNKKDACE